MRQLTILIAVQLVLLTGAAFVPSVVSAPQKEQKVAEPLSGEKFSVYYVNNTPVTLGTMGVPVKHFGEQASKFPPAGFSAENLSRRLHQKLDPIIIESKFYSSAKVKDLGLCVMLVHDDDFTNEGDHLFTKINGLHSVTKRVTKSQMPKTSSAFEQLVFDASIVAAQEAAILHKVPALEKLLKSQFPEVTARASKHPKMIVDARETVNLHIKLSDNGFFQTIEFFTNGNLEDQIDATLSNAKLGKWIGHETGLGEQTIGFSGPSAEAIYQVIVKGFKNRIPKGSTIELIKNGGSETRKVPE